MTRREREHTGIPSVTDRGPGRLAIYRRLLAHQDPEPPSEPWYRRMLARLIWTREDPARQPAEVQVTKVLTVLIVVGTGLIAVGCDTSAKESARVASQGDGIAVYAVVRFDGCTLYRIEGDRRTVYDTDRRTVYVTRCGRDVATDSSYTEGTRPRREVEIDIPTIEREW